MSKLAANWPFLLVSQIARGQFLIRPEIAYGMAAQLIDLMEGKTVRGEKRSMNLQVVGNHLAGRDYLKSWYLDDDDDDEVRSDSHSPYDDAPKGSAAIIPLRSTMMKYGSLCDYGTTEIADMMRTAASHKNIGSVVLDIDSGGGAVDAIAPMVDAIRYAKALGKPVVSSVDMCCSAAMWVASETDAIVADNSISAEIGSIGVMMSFMDMREYYESKGIKVHEIYSSLSNHKNSDFREARDGKYEPIQSGLLDPLAVAFQETIRANRAGKLDESEEEVLGGGTFFAEKAKKVGLIDHVGSKAFAIELALGMSHAKNYKL
jgi:protease-4